MRKECFTCVNKVVNELTEEEYQEKKNKEKELAKKEKRWPNRIPELEFFCDVSKKQIKQTDPACEHYKDNEDLVDIRKMISDTARKLRKELN